MRIDDWFVGIVEDLNDPSSMGRVRVRCLGYHTPDRSQLPTIDLPLATVMLPTTSASTCGIGVSSTGLLPNTWVIGFFRDGIELQDPVIIGTIASASGYDVGYDVITNLGYGDPHAVFSDFIGSDIPREATNTGSYSGASAMNNGAANSAANVYYNSNGLITSFDQPIEIPSNISNGAADRIVHVAETQIGVKETSTNRGPGIEKYWSSVSYRGGYNDAAPWCAAFVCWCIQQSGVLPESERPKEARAYSLEDWGRGKSYVQTRRNPRYVLKGDIITFASFSHVAIAYSNSDSSGKFQSIDGNSGDRVKISSRHIGGVRCAMTIGNGSNALQSTNTMA